MLTATGETPTDNPNPLSTDTCPVTQQPHRWYGRTPQSCHHCAAIRCRYGQCRAAATHTRNGLPVCREHEDARPSV